MRLYKKTVHIAGYGDFDMICNIELKGDGRGMFSIDYPTRIVDKIQIKKDALATTTMGAVIIDTIYECTLEKAEEEFEQRKLEFETIDSKYRLVIRYTVDNDWSRSDGSGCGLFLNWGVFREVTFNNKKQYFFVDTSEGEKTIHDVFHDLKTFKLMEWSPEREDFFRKLTKGIKDIKQRLDFFVANCDEVIANNQQLLINQ